MSADDDGLLSRWSRRKRAVAEEAKAETAAESHTGAGITEEIPQGVDADLSEPELLEKLGLPDPDTLKAGDDFKAFMAKNVPEFLRKRALRRLWGSNPVLANLDGLIDHGEDYTDAATVPEVFKSAYKAGRGFLKEVLKEEPEAETVAIAEGDAPPVADDLPQEIAAGEPVEADRRIEQDAAPEDGEPPRPRRMSFRSS